MTGPDVGEPPDGAATDYAAGSVWLYGGVMYCAFNVGGVWQVDIPQAELVRGQVPARYLGPSAEVRRTTSGGMNCLNARTPSFPCCLPTCETYNCTQQGFVNVGPG